MSAALTALYETLGEVEALQRANPSPLSSAPFKRPDVTRAIGRSQIVLLSSHLERYIYALNEEAVEALVCRAVPVAKLASSFRLLHARAPVEALASTAWENRSDALKMFAETEARLWMDGAIAVDLEAARLLEWMKAPSSKSMVRYFKQWGIDDIFRAITRTPTNRTDLWLRIDGLVEKRNNIAHGDASVEATYLDISRYLGGVRRFTERADRVLGRQLQMLLGERPW